MVSVSQIKIALPLAALVLAVTWVMADFVVPNKGGRKAAVGSLIGMEETMQRAFLTSDQFEAKKEPRGMDWLAQHEEEGQTFPQYLSSKPNRPGAGGRSTLYVLPLGDFPKETSLDLTVLRKYMELYYGPMAVKVLPAMPEERVPALTRKNSLTGSEQWHTGTMLEWLKTQVPRDCYGLIAITMTDLYPGEGWNFVFGQASYKSRVGIFSFARYHPKLNYEDVNGDADQIALRRAGKVLTHEMGHMFGIKHCIHYECNMNGANSLRECDSSPMHLCPVCLRKLQHAVGFDPLFRYRSLGKFYGENQFKEEAGWVSERVKWIANE